MAEADPQAAAITTNGNTENTVIASMCQAMSTVNLVLVEDITKDPETWLRIITHDKFVVNKLASYLGTLADVEEFERCQREQVFTWVPAVVCFLVNHPDHQKHLMNILMHETEANREFMVTFFTKAVDAFEPLVDGETQVEFELRRHETSVTLQASLQNFYRSDGWNSNLEEYILTNFRRGEQLFKDKAYRQAGFAYNDALLAAAARPFAAELSNNILAEFNADPNDSFADPERLVPRDFIYKVIKAKQIECLLMDQQYKKASVMANYMIHWMANHKTCGIKGYFAVTHPDSYSLLQIWMGEAEVALDEPNRAIDLCNLAVARYCRLFEHASLDHTIFSIRKTFLERLSDYFEDEEEPENNIKSDRDSAQIIVDPTADHGVVNGQFIVNDLDSALRIAKNHDIIFLEVGTFSGKSSRQQSGHIKQVTELNKPVTIIGSSAKRSILSGSIVKTGSGQACLKRLKIEIGDNEESDADVYLLEGSTVISNCMVECTVNTGFYILNSSDHVKTSLTFDYCVLDGLELCKRFVTMQGDYPELIVKNCYACDMYSFCTVIAPNEKINANINFQNSVIYEVQDGLKMLTHPSSSVSAQVIGCHFELVLYDQECSSTAVSLNCGSMVASNSYVLSNHPDAVGFYLSDLERAELQMILLEITEDVTRLFSLAQGVVLNDCKLSVLDHIEVIGVRIGFQVSTHSSDLLPHPRQCTIHNCTTKSCAVGVSVRSNEDEDDRSRVREINNRVEIVRSHFETTHYGLMVETGLLTRVSLESSAFFDVAKPILLRNSSSRGLTLSGNDFRLSSIFFREDDNEAEVVRERMFLHFATNENLPHRPAYDHDNFHLISSAVEQEAFIEQQQQHLQEQQQQQQQQEQQ